MHILGFAITVNFGCIKFNDIRTILESPLKLAWDPIFAGLNKVPKSVADDVLFILKKYVETSNFVGDCVKAIAKAI